MEWANHFLVVNIRLMLLQNVSLIKCLAVTLVFLSTSATAHELTPTYPQLRPSYLKGLHVTTMKLWNRRDDVSYYEISVYDADWNAIGFATPNRLIKIDYLQSKSIELYIREQDVARTEFICTTSKLLKQDVQSSGIKSRICSRVR